MSLISKQTIFNNNQYICIHNHINIYDYPNILDHKKIYYIFHNIFYFLYYLNVQIYYQKLYTIYIHLFLFYIYVYLYFYMAYYHTFHNNKTIRRNRTHAMFATSHLLKVANGGGSSTDPYWWNVRFFTSIPVDVSSMCHFQQTTCRIFRMRKVSRPCGSVDELSMCHC